MKKDIVLIGVGNCGSQVANYAEKTYPELFDTIYINSSDVDLSMIETDNDAIKFKIGNIGEVEGSGKNRTKMKEFLLNDIQKILSNKKLQETISEKEYCFIITSAAGGTGSGASPVLLDILRQMFPDTHFVLVGVLPQLRASLMEQGNTLEFLKELYEVLGDGTTYMIYDNETKSDLSPTQILEEVNKDIIEDIKVLTGVNNFPTPYESIDKQDLFSIISTPGRIVIARVEKGITEKYMEDNKLDDLIIKEIKSSSHTETDRNKKITRCGIITYFTDSVNKLYDTNLEGLTDFIGTPIERFNHNAINPGKDSMNFLNLIATGLSPINDRTQKITERIDELKKALATDETNKYILEGEGASYDIMEERRKQDRRNRQVDTVVPAEIFKKFM